MKKLGIVVPTFNRVEILGSTLKAIIIQAESCQENIDIVVCDNASEDGTQQFMQEFVKKHPYVRYYRHKENKGYLYNFKFGIEKTDAEYVFLHGDDDLMPPYFVYSILHYLKEYPDVGLFHFNYFISDLNDSPFRTLYNHFDDNANCKQYQTGKDFIFQHFDLPSFMSSNVFRKDLWSLHVDDKQQFECIAYEWLYVLYKGIETSPCVYIPFPLFVQRMSKYEGYSSKLSLYFIVGISRVFEELGDDYFEKWKEYRKTYSKPKMLRNITSVYRDKNFYKERYKLMRSYLDGAFYKFVLFASLYVIPTSVENFLFNKFRKIFVG